MQARKCGLLFVVTASHIHIYISNAFPLDSLVLFGAQVVTDLDGNFIIQIGSTGEEGLHDGTFVEATFNRPQVEQKKP